MGMQIDYLHPFALQATYSNADVTALFLAAKSAFLRLYSNLEVDKHSLREKDGLGGLKPFDRDTISADDRRWIEEQEALLAKGSAALARFGYKL